MILKIKMLLWEHVRQALPAAMLPILVLLINFTVILISWKSLDVKRGLSEIADYYVLTAAMVAMLILLTHLARRDILEFGHPLRLLRVPLPSRILFPLLWSARNVIAATILIISLFLHRVLLGESTFVGTFPAFAGILSTFLLAQGILAVAGNFGRYIQLTLLLVPAGLAAFFAQDLSLLFLEAPVPLLLGAVVFSAWTYIPGATWLRSGVVWWAENNGRHRLGKQCMAYADIPYFCTPGDAISWYEGQTHGKTRRLGLALAFLISAGWFIYAKNYSRGVYSSQALLWTTAMLSLLVLTLAGGIAALRDYHDQLRLFWATRPASVADWARASTGNIARQAFLLYGALLLLLPVIYWLNLLSLRDGEVHAWLWYGQEFSSGLEFNLSVLHGFLLLVLLALTMNNLWNRYLLVGALMCLFSAAIFNAESLQWSGGVLVCMVAYSAAVHAGLITPGRALVLFTVALGASMVIKATQVHGKFDTTFLPPMLVMFAATVYPALVLSFQRRRTGSLIAPPTATALEYRRAGRQILKRCAIVLVVLAAVFTVHITAATHISMRMQPTITPESWQQRVDMIAYQRLPWAATLAIANDLEASKGLNPGGSPRSAETIDTAAQALRAALAQPRQVRNITLQDALSLNVLDRTSPWIPEARRQNNRGDDFRDQFKNRFQIYREATKIAVLQNTFSKEIERRLESEDKAAAVPLVLALAGLTSGLLQEPIPQIQVYAAGISVEQLAIISRALENAPWTKAELDALQSLLEVPHLMDVAEITLRANQFHAMRVFDTPGLSLDINWYSTTGRTGEAERNLATLMYKASSRAAMDRIVFALNCRDLLNQMQAPGFRSHTTPFRGEKPGHFWLTPNSALLIPEIQFAAAVYKRQDINQNLLRTAVALMRYKQVHGEYPSHLHVLVPEYLSELPIDWPRDTISKEQAEGDPDVVVRNGRYHRSFSLSTRENGAELSSHFHFLQNGLEPRRWALWLP